MLREYTDDMREISGFGKGYEATCRKMVLAGLDWFDAHPDADPTFHSYKGIYGALTEDNDDAKALTAAMIAAADGDCTGAMYEATVGHVLWIRAHSWEQYVIDARKDYTDEQAGEKSDAEQHP